MAQNFRNYLTQNTGTSPVDALGGAANSYDTLISVRMANITTSTIAVDVYLRRSSANYYLIKKLNKLYLKIKKIMMLMLHIKYYLTRKSYLLKH